MNVILCGGGTAGHITPAISIYDYMKKEGHKPRLVVAQKDYHLIPGNYDFNTININSPGNFFKKIIFILKFIPALLKSYNIIKKHNPDCVIGMGGFVSFPMLYAAKTKNIPIFLCEQNSIPGKVNRMFYKDAKRAYLTFSKTLEFMPNGKVFGNPVRNDFFVVHRESARIVMKLKEDDKLLVVMGGSQGALKLNELFFECIKDIKAKVNNLYIVWLAGPKWANDMIAKVNNAKFENVFVHSYYKDMANLLHAADFVISRAGSSSISEILAVNVPSLLVPFPYATDNHQYFNALDLLNKDMAYLIEESDLDKEKLENVIINNLNNDERLKKMRENIKSNWSARAVSSIVDDITEVLGKK
ncbi:UDP-N-acetylglucosamine--N-acetylmuramyl-(pentapeptide) pyrophosphoryl-undecaprenol N-acetylglucosamine transferase [Brachyspira hampsonii]|uniref:UDP-N-acetylglucosamine--N-acetylmuramyl-(pentapeptide) pyrophosphoryl-undecaprenol N-acetylglucosamine transferase n=1 Tax=Brachyspira hampsonii TaxID=1287055 RepID=A0AAC9XLR0_9SPIR|nr:UDP-N-acetylglucosamine--N-acetylmuramyl-(pentapeptide) pyrophosphoryl-undecaprenol N-acetylglucosamine transferase [Brachyspira hampsonii]ASJ22633.1 undecaprenyldiphospho-muramoylpentapeptide beta-N- acetylglucosaminyltransferase [Brachyspira hampsonii]ELV06530.1 N-acetylglucosaminyl transferase [Brachyspira hampsonii 30599]MBW5379791.1 UDP-N-acetylglucosamine--N-acetylmuramyl-(pentapeptide) pyrophosphoryl-undecaprenol N-acetylglucosamine transferase [Brachyspira hampsonii]OEJ19328.1 UDP-N-